MSMYWILFIGIAVISYIVQNSLQSKFKKYSKMPLASGMKERMWLKKCYMIMVFMMCV